MLHLLPIRLLIQVFATSVGLMAIAAFYAGYADDKDTAQLVQLVLRWGSSLSFAAVALVYAAWRWIPFVQASIFPYLGGRWAGQVRYVGKEGKHADKPVRLEAKHTLFGLRFLLDSDESTSTTLAVHAEKDPDFNKFRLYYVYLNSRKEGVLGSGETYRGLAIVRWEDGAQPTLEGDYFTETARQGTLHLRRVSRTAFWKIWR